MSFSKIVVGVDFSEQSQAAVRHAMAIARRTDAELTLLHVCNIRDAVPPLIDDAMRPLVEHWDEVLRARLAENRARLGDLRESIDGQGVVISQMIRDGFPADELVAAAKELPADLVAIGTHGYTSVKRFLLGSVVERVVRRATTSLLVARGTPPPRGYRKILAPVGFGPLADSVVSTAVALAGDGATVELFHCWSMPGSTWAAVDVGLAGGGKLRGAIVRSIEDQLDELVARHGAAGVTIETSHTEAGARLGVQARLAEGDIDLAVLGSHAGRRRVSELAFGTVAAATVRHAPCAVVVVRENV